MTRERAHQPHSTWTRLEATYLAAEDVWGQSGFRGDAARWEAARRVIALALHRDGTFLDIGCANGLLLESMVNWAEAAGYAIEPYGLDISPALAELARRRLPHWTERIHTGDAMTWEPPWRFDFARTELVYAPDELRACYLRRLLERVVVPGGRLIVCSYGSARRPEPRVEPLGELLTNWGFRVAGEAEAVDPQHNVSITRVAWIEAG